MSNGASKHPTPGRERLESRGVKVTYPLALLGESVTLVGGANEPIICIIVVKKKFENADILEIKA